MVEIPTRISRLSSCIMLGVSCKRILSRMPVGRNTVQWGPAILQAMTYPIHENGFRRALTRYILHLSAVTEQCLKWHDVMSILVRRLCHLTALLWQMCVLLCVSRFVPDCTVTKFGVLRKTTNCMNRPISKYRFFRELPYFMQWVCSLIRI